jgi:hypothetical protein
MFFLGLLVRLVEETTPLPVAAFIVIGMGAATLAMIPFLFTNQVVVMERRYWLSALRSSALLVVRSTAASFAIALLLIALFAVPYVAGDLLTYGVLPLPFRELDVSDGDLPASFGGRIASSVLDTAFVPIESIYLTVAYYYVKRGAGMERDAVAG